MAQNKAAWLTEAGLALVVEDAPLYTAGPTEIVVKNAAIAINPLDSHMQDIGIFVQQFPAIIGCDVAGEVYEVGSDVTRFRKGDRVIGHCVNLVSGRPSDGAYQLYTVVPEDKAAILPKHIPFTDGVVMPFAIEAAVCALSVKEPGPCMPGVMTPALALPLPPTEATDAAPDKVLIVYGASSSVGCTVTQMATLAGIQVVGIAAKKNETLVKQAGAIKFFDRKDPAIIEKVVEAVKLTGLGFAGIVDAISIPTTYSHDLAMIERLGGGHLACTHPPPTENVPENVKTGMIFAVNDVVAPVFHSFVTTALQSGKLKCLPEPTIVGKGLEHINEAIKKSKAGVSATKIVVEL